MASHESNWSSYYIDWHICSSYIYITNITYCIVVATEQRHSTAQSKSCSKVSDRQAQNPKPTRYKIQLSSTVYRGGRTIPSFPAIWGARARFFLVSNCKEYGALNAAGWLMGLLHNLAIFFGVTVVAQSWNCATHSQPERTLWIYLRVSRAHSWQELLLAR